MKVEDIKEIMKAFKETGLSSIEFENESSYLRLENVVTVVEASTVAVSNTKNNIISEEVASEIAEFSHQTINAPLVGTFYASSSPDKPAFVKVGQTINEGDVVCIVEAMKVMNEIKATTSGVVKEVCVKDGQGVSYDQVLFVIE